MNTRMLYVAAVLMIVSGLLRASAGVAVTNLQTSVTQHWKMADLLPSISMIIVGLGLMVGGIWLFWSQTKTAIIFGAIVTAVYAIAETIYIPIMTGGNYRLLLIDWALCIAIWPMLWYGQKNSK